MDWLDLVLRTIDMKLYEEIPWGVGRPAGLGFSLVWLNFVYVFPEFKYSPKLVELVNFSKNYRITVQKVRNSKECWQ